MKKGRSSLKRSATEGKIEEKATSRRIRREIRSEKEPIPWLSMGALHARNLGLLRRRLIEMVNQGEREGRVAGGWGGLSWSYAARKELRAKGRGVSR